jgi:hypothetical protein
MPYVNCHECGVRSFALAPWSTVDRCPACDAPLSVPRQSMAEDLHKRPYWWRSPSRNRRGAAPDEAQGTR